MSPSRIILIAVLLTAGTAGAIALLPTPDDPRPVDVFKALDGHWKGNFVGYDTTGKELYRIRVEQRYRTIDANTQKVTIRDTMPDGKVITGEGENLARRREDGSLELRCVVRKSNGEQVEHQGRLVEGPDGDKQLVWYSETKDRIETFREAVRTEGTKQIYTIDGLGRYGGSLMLMHGRYTRQPTQR